MPVYKDSKTNLWYVKINMTQFQGKYKSIKKRGFKTKKEASAFEKELINQNTDTGALTFSQFFNVYMEEMSHVLAPRTLQVRKAYCQKHLLPLWGNKPMNTLTADTIIEWQKNALNQKVLKSSSVEQVTKILSSIFKCARRLHNLKHNPFDKLYNPIPESKPQYAIWSPTDLQKSLIDCKEAPVESLTIKMLYFMGLRMGELFALTPADIDNQEKSIHISKSYSYHTKMSGPTKTPQSKRTLLLPPHLYEELNTYITEHCIPANTRIFQTTYPRKIRTYLKNSAKKWNIPIIRIHDLRHSNASLLNELGFSPFIIKNRLGHRTIETTINTYTQIFNEQEESLANHLNYLESEDNTTPPYPIIIDIDQNYTITIPNFPEINSFQVSSLNDAKKQSFKFIQKCLNNLMKKGKTYPESINLSSIPIKKNRIILLYTYTDTPQLGNEQRNRSHGYKFPL